MENTSQFFDFIYRNTRTNAMVIMNADGIIQEVNEAFYMAFGYTTEDLNAKHFRIFYIEKDQVTRKPEIELNQVLRTGAANDDNYLVHKDGTPIWVTGESILVKAEGGTWIVKLIHNIHAQKQLERYLLSTSELLDSLFESVKQSGLLLLNAQMKVVRSNKAFRKMFGIEEQVAEGSKLQEISHAFWQKEELKNEVRNVLVKGGVIKKEFLSSEGEDNIRRYEISSKLISGDGSEEQQLLLMVKHLER